MATFFRDYEDQKLSDEENNRFLEKIVSEIKGLENNPFDNFEITIVSSKRTDAFYVTYDSINEERELEIISQPSAVSSLDEPQTTQQNINLKEYKIDPKRFETHQERLIVPKSSYITTCSVCNGDGSDYCGSCNGNGKCSKCIGSGEIRCQCGNGNCSNCAGRGEVTCTGARCSMGRCTDCSGTGRRINSGKSESCRTCVGSGRCKSCSGKGVKKCNVCSGSGKHSECRGSGRIPCKSCSGKGHCKRCFGKGRVTCYKCEGNKYLMNNLEIVSSFTHLNDSLSLIDPEIKTTREINFEEIITQVDLIKENSSSSFNLHELDSFSQITEISEYLKNRHYSIDSEKKILERIRVYKVPIFTINYKFENKEYVSYFIGSNEEHFFKTNPILEYSEKLEGTIAKLIQETNYSQAIILLDEQQIRYSHIGDIEKSDNSRSFKESLQLDVQKDLVKGSTIAQVVYTLFEILILYYLTFSCLSPSTKDINSLFLVTALGFLLLRLGFYLKHLAPFTILKTKNKIELNQFLNGDENASYYFIDTKGLKWSRIIGAFILLVTFINAYKTKSLEPYVSFVLVYFIAFACSLFVNIFVDVFYNRKITKHVESISNSKSRIVRSFLISICSNLLPSSLILFFGSLFINPEIDFDSISSSKGTQNVSFFLMISFTFLAGMFLLKYRKGNTSMKSFDSERKIPFKSILKFVLFGVTILGVSYLVLFFLQYKDIKNQSKPIVPAYSSQNKEKKTSKEIQRVSKTDSETNTRVIQALLKNVEEGDAGYYLEFVDPISGEILSFSYAEWQFKDQLIEDFCDNYWVNGVAKEKEFMLELQWSKIKEHEYRGFDEGSVETGRIIDAWTLVSVYPGWTQE